MQRQDLTGHEQWQGCLELLRLNPGWTQKDLAEQLHIDPSMVRPPAVAFQVHRERAGGLCRGRIGISDCYAISRLDQAEQAAALAMKLDGASRDQLANHARRQKNGDKPSVRTGRVKCELGGGVSIVITGKALGLDEVIEGRGRGAQRGPQGAIRTST